MIRVVQNDYHIGIEWSISSYAQPVSHFLLLPESQQVSKSWKRILLFVLFPIIQRVFAYPVCLENVCRWIRLVQLCLPVNWLSIAYQDFIRWVFAVLELAQIHED